MSLKTKIIVLFLFNSLSLTAQKENSINYLYQNKPGLVAQVFAPGILSTDALEHSSPAFSPDGKTVVWAVMRMPSYQICLLEMNLIGNKWSPAHVPTFSDTTANEVYPNFSTDGQTLYFSSNRSVNNYSFKYQTLWHVDKTADGWSEARPLDTNVFKKDIYAYSISKNGVKYFTIGPHGTMDWNIFYTDSLGKSSPMPPYINTKGYEDGPFIADDESYLIFESDRPTGVKDDIDLYISFRKKDRTWTEPINLGPEVNSAWAERFAKVSPDGKYLFFGRNRGNGFDIYWIDSDIIEKIKKQTVKEGLQE